MRTGKKGEDRMCTLNNQCAILCKLHVQRRTARTACSFLARASVEVWAQLKVPKVISTTARCSASSRRNALPVGGKSHLQLSGTIDLIVYRRHGAGALTLEFPKLYCGTQIWASIKGLLSTKDTSVSGSDASLVFPIHLLYCTCSQRPIMAQSHGSVA